MKGKISILLILTLVISIIAGCGRTNNITKNKNSSQISSISKNIEGKTPSSESKIIQEGVKPYKNDEIISYIIENKGLIPEGITESNLRQMDLSRVNVILIESVQNLDADGLKPYISEKDYDFYSINFKRIKENSEDALLWQNTIGQIIYYPNSDIIIGKDLEYVRDKWYTDCYLLQSNIPADDASEFSKEYLLDIYENYYKDAPYLAGRDVYLPFKIIDGKITFDISKMFNSLLYPDVDEIINYNFIKNDNKSFFYDKIILGDSIGYNLGYEYIEKDTNNRSIREDYIALIDKNLDYIIDRSSKYLLYYESDSYVVKTYNNYFINRKNRKLIQEYLDKYCEIYLDVNDVTVFYHIDINSYPLYYLTDEDKLDLEKRNITIVDKTYLNWLSLSEDPLQCFSRIKLILESNSK